MSPCRSELAREKRKVNAFTQTVRVFVDVHREQACSYKGPRCQLGHETRKRVKRQNAVALTHTIFKE
ncbi:hypothetical protein J2W17_001359 [Pseudomonas lini]|nr:hypothetical protein [Pseudomonas lini]